MPGELGDFDTEGRFAVLVRILQAAPWANLGSQMGIPVRTFEGLGLDRHTPDAIVWQICQDQGLVLITGNRNQFGADSLEAVIRARNTPSSLPVFTLADAARIFTDKAYARRTAGRILEYLLDIEQYRGTGCLFVP